MDKFSTPIKLKSTSKWNNWTSFELIFVTLICTFLVWYAQFHWNRRKIYRHASKVPGVPGYPVIGSVMSFLGNPYDIFSTIMRMFNSHSGIFIVWFGPRCFYAISDPKYFEILLPNCLEKEKWYDRLNFVVGEGLFTARFKKWKKLRKLISPTFNQKILDSFVPIFNEQSQILLKQLKNYVGKGEFDLFHTISNCTLDIICQTAMGVTVNAQTSNSHFSQCCDRAMEIIFLKIFVWWYHIHPIFSLTRLSKELLMCLRTIDDFTGKVVNEKITEFENQRQSRHFDEYVDEGPRRKAFLDYLLEITKKENSAYSEKQLRDEVVTFIIAGSDTTATTNGFVFTMLGLHKDLQEIVYNEVVDVVGTDRDVEPEDLPRLKYLERFIKETLRLFPVGPFILREVHRDVDLGDNTIVPAGVSVIFGILKLHRNELYWPDPLKFDPNRFLPEEVAKRHPCCYVPFSYGPRNCIGLKYAMMAMKTLVATVVRRYKFSTGYKNVEDIKIKCNLVMRPRDGFKVSLELR